MNATAAADQAFWARGGSLFDFTLRFEEIILSISLSSIFVASSPLFIYHHYQRRPRCESSGLLLWAKLLASASLIAIRAAVLVVTSRQPEYRTDTTIPAGAIDLLAALLVAAVAHVDHHHSLCSSGPFSLYLFVASLADITKSRSFFLRAGRQCLGGLAAAAASLELLLLCLQEVSKRQLIIEASLRKDAGLEATSGAIGRMLLLFLRPLFATGFRKQLMLEDLDRLDPELAPQLLYRQLTDFWRPHAKPPAASRELFKASLKAWRQHLPPIGTSRLIITALRFSQPFLLHQIIIMVEDKDTGSFATAKRVGLIGATVFVFFGLAMAQSIFGYLMNRHVTRLRGGLVAFLFHKVHHVTETEAKKVAAVTLMTADIDGIALGLPKALDLPFGVLEISLGIFLLSRFVKVAALAVFAPVVVTSVATYFIGRNMATRFVAWNECIEQRIAKTARLLPQLTTIKMLGLGPSTAAYLKSLRVEEIDVSKKYRLLEAVAVAPVLLADLMTPVVVIAAALFGPAFHGRMVADRVFPTLTVVALIQSPLAGVLNVYPLITRMLSCFQRIESFLCTAERKDSRNKIDLTAGVDSSLPLNSRVRFNNADLAKHGMQEALIRDANFQLPSGSTTAIVGRTGSGKSTIVQAILGECKVLKGSVQVGAKISYCAQTVWLQDTTIRQNVVGYQEYNARKFHTVLHACFLEEDVNRLPNGADYAVGPNGSNLSGGQRQRLAIARAAYVAAEVTVLDDVFSSLDHNTAVTILHRLCGKGGILQEAGCTVVIVTYLSDCVDVCSHVLFLDGNGSVTLRDDPQTPDLLNHILATLNTANNSGPILQKNQEGAAVSRTLEAAPTPAPTDSDTTTRKGNLGLYRMFVDPIGRLNSVLYGFFVSLLSAGEALPEVYIRVWVELHPANSLYFLGYITVVLGTCAVGCMVYWLMHGKLSPRSSITLHSMLVDRTMGATLRFLSVTKTGHLLNFYNQDMMLLSRNLPASFIRTIYAGAYVFFQIGIILSGASYLAISIPFLATAVYFIQRYYLRTSRQIRLLDLEIKAPLHTYFEETATGLSHIRAFDWEEKSIERGLILLAESQRPYYVMMTIQQWLVLILGLITGSLAVLLVTLALFIRQASSQTSVGLSFLSLLSLSKTFAATIIAWTALEVSKGALSRLFQFREKTPQEQKVSQEPLPAVWPCSGKVQFSNVVARFKPEDEGAEPVLDGISLSVRPGQRVGIVGRSGSGKSALLLTLLGFIKYNGAVEIDGIDITSVSRDDLRSRLITITQDQFCFKGTVRTNLLPVVMKDPGQKSADGAEKAALKDNELEELLKSLHIWTQIAGKGGLGAVLDEVGYSKGELQLLCIARAILKQRDTSGKLVLVDEATSSVDAETEEIVNRVMTEYFSDCTMIIVAHRQSSLDNVHTVIEMNQGKIVGVEHLQAEQDPLRISPPGSS